jgi:hypothetical protein
LIRAIWLILAQASNGSLEIQIVAGEPKGFTKELKELETLKGPYKSKRESEKEKARKIVEANTAEMSACFSKIRVVESHLSGIDFEIEDEEPFFRNRRREYPEMGYRWVLLKKADTDKLFMRQYSDDSGGEMLEEFEPTDEYPLDLIQHLCDRLPGFVKVVKIKVKDALKQ